MDIYSILSSKPHTPHYLSRYIKFIHHCQQKNIGYRGPSEKHHICPKAKDMFPEYESFKKHKWNCAVLTIRQHLIAHLILCKVYDNVFSVTEAYWHMSNYRGNKINSKIFQELRVTRLINITEKSRNKSEKCKRLISEKVKRDWATMSDEKRQQKIEAMSKGHVGQSQPEWKKRQHSELMSGSGNSRAKVIYIFDEKGNVRFKCHGNFKKVCKDNNLPHSQLRKSHANNGVKIGQTMRSSLDALKRGWTEFQGWSAVEIIEP